MQRLVKTSIKKNLYREIKDRVIEETYNGIRMNKVKRKAFVYGLNSTKDVRARLIEILHERVRYHKDKFVSEILLNEMKSMEVKKSGKVEHSKNSHDDQVFSYLMALYVWYDGKNLMENWHIEKNTLKTDQNLDIEEYAFEDELEGQGERIDLEYTSYEPESEAAQALEWIEQNSKFTTSEDLKNSQYDQIIQMREKELANNKQFRERYAAEYGLDPAMFDTNQSGINFVKLPDTIFAMDTDIIDDDVEGEYFGVFDNPGNVPYDQNKVLQGNLAHLYNQV